MYGMENILQQIIVRTRVAAYGWEHANRLSYLTWFGFIDEYDASAPKALIILNKSLAGKGYKEGKWIA